ncbi:MAG: formate/nitrite transporter family protein [Hydrogenophaga sp.]|uniref:formate/nitrite transporter family protein n=1 Tax=Hydrogenophaga sp. TaxID=1904254 RepID=UPI003D9BA3B3
MSELFGSDAYAPCEVAQRIETVGVAKARMATLPPLMLGVLAGAFIGLGSLFFNLVRSDATLGFATGQVLGGVVFALGLLLVVVAGAELFTGNNLIVMAWADGRIGSAEVLRNWVLVCLAVWMAMAGRSVVDKAVAVVPPVAAFVAAGFEHSIANMYFFPLAMLVQAGDPALAAHPVTWNGLGANLLPIIAGNLLGGSVLVGLSYHLIYRTRAPT